MTKVGEVFRSDYVTVFRNGCSESVAVKGAVQWRAICGGLLTEWRGSREVAENEARAFVGLPQVEQYRPFKNAKEFTEFLGRDKWLVCKVPASNESWRGRVIAYCDDWVLSSKGALERSWYSMFHEYEFEDGTPFGVKVS